MYIIIITIIYNNWIFIIFCFNFLLNFIFNFIICNIFITSTIYSHSELFYKFNLRFFKLQINSLIFFHKNVFYNNNNIYKSHFFLSTLCIFFIFIISFTFALRITWVYNFCWFTKETF